MQLELTAPPLYIMKFITCFIASVFIGHSAYSQKNVANLLSELKKSTTEETRVEAYNSLFKYYEVYKPDSAIYYAQAGMKEFKASGYERGIAAMTVLMAFMDSYQGRLDMAREKHEAALAIYTRVGYKRGIATVHNGLGVLDCRTAKYPAATKHFMEALRLFESLNDVDGIVNTYLKLGVVNEQSENLPKALEYYSMCITQLERRPVKGTNLIYLYNNIGIVYAKMGNLDKALHYFDQALAGSNTAEETGLRIHTLINLGIVYDKTNNVKKSLEYFDEALKITKDKNMPEEFARISINRASVISKTDPATAIETLKEALETARAVGNKSMQADVYDSMVDTYDRLGKHKEALAILRLLRVLEDSLVNVEKAKEIMNLEKSNAKLALAEQTRDANALVRNIIIAVAVLLAVVLVLLLLVYKKSTRLNEQLKKREAELSRSNEIKDRLFSVIGHDLRGPIGNVPDVLQLLDNPATSPEERKYMLESLVRHSKASLETLDKLLYWGKAQIKGIGIDQVSFSAGEHISHNMQLSKSSADQKHITIIDNVPNDTMVFADPSHFDFIIRNLLSNAIKFTHNNGSVVLSADTNSKPGFVVFAVKDTGIGISADKLPDIFKPFSSTTRGTADEKGTNIGLMLCKEFVTENGGDIWVETKIGQGSTFYFSLKA